MSETLLMDLKKIYQQNISGKMARFTQENGKKAYKMEKENYKKSKAKSLYWLTKVTGSMEKSKAPASLFGTNPDHFTKEISIMANPTAMAFSYPQTLLI